MEALLNEWGMSAFWPVMVLGAYYAAALHFAWQPFVASLPLAFLVTAILQANNLRDIETDLANHKRTLANLFGRRVANGELGLLYAGAYGTIVLATTLGALPWLALATWLTIGQAWSNLRIAQNETEPAILDRAVLGSAKLLDADLVLRRRLLDRREVGEIRLELIDRGVRQSRRALRARSLGVDVEHRDRWVGIDLDAVLIHRLGDVTDVALRLGVDRR